MLLEPNIQFDVVQFVYGVVVFDHIIFSPALLYPYVLALRSPQLGKTLSLLFVCLFASGDFNRYSTWVFLQL